MKLKQSIIVTVLITLPFLGLEMSPLAGSWPISLVIWSIWLVLLAGYFQFTYHVLQRIEVRSPIRMGRSEQKPTPVKSKTATNERITLIHDTVKWEDVGVKTYPLFPGYKNVVVEGPLCPECDTELTVRGLYGDYKRSETISKENPLKCISCDKEYVLADRPRRLHDSEQEIRLKFEGMRRKVGEF